MDTRLVKALADRRLGPSPPPPWLGIDVDEDFYLSMMLGSRRDDNCHRGRCQYG